MLCCPLRESGNLSFQLLTCFWIPAFAGMTSFYKCINSCYLNKKVVFLSFIQCSETRANLADSSQERKSILVFTRWYRFWEGVHSGWSKFHTELFPPKRKALQQ